MKQLTNQWDKPSLILHSGFATAVVVQLALSLIMHRPYVGRVLPAYQANAFRAHMFVGLSITVLVFLYWLWVMFARRDTLQHLFPWHRRGLQQIKHDLMECLRLRLPNQHVRGGLSGFVQGLGLSLVTLVGSCGTVLFFTLPQTKSMSPIVHFVKETHEYLAYWVWWYVIGHGGMAIVHGVKNWLKRTPSAR